ncbi:hypothetical protein SCHPADRAFT_929762 [Schizopora paradoxa]|uniref:F-box domain-containing protein n=1 Tax=Schizopora paradoxa TaxID=27342 RepID=A0A0H2RQB5_9AGAM|nr:hypothetical protein SCHPADRAFT_929762 [Schizopora paradoxa]
MANSQFMGAKRMIATAIQLFSEEMKVEAASYDSEFPWSKAAVDIVDDIVEFSELRQAVRTVKVVERMLQSMLTSASDVATRLNVRFTDAVNKTKFSAIPDDILANIFEMANQDSDIHTNDVGVRLSLVSRRFNRIATKLPLLWSTISFPRQSNKLVKQFAFRASTPCISLTIDRNYENSGLEDQRVLDMYQIMTSISSRIRSLSLSLGSYDFTYLSQILASCSSCSFPSLVKLELECDRSTSRICQPFCRDWDLPLLRELELTEIIPEFQAGVLKQIDIGFIKLNEVDKRWSSVARWQTPEITAFLRSLTSVTDLYLSIQFLRGHSVDCLRKLSMPSVKNLRVEFQSLDAATSLNILDHIRFSEIEVFDLSLILLDLTQLGDAIDAVKASLARFTREGGAMVKDLVLVVEQVSDFFENNDAPFGRIARWAGEFKNLENIYLECTQHRGRGIFSLTDIFDTFKLQRREEPISETMMSMLRRGVLLSN